MNSRPRSASTLSRAPPSATESSPSKRPPSARVRSSHDSTQQRCPLDDPDLGVVPMTDHQNRRCLCRFCTCGEHRCPGEVQASPYPKAMFTSQYQAHHSTKTPIKALVPVRREYRENVNPMEMLTQYELAFRPFRIAVTEQNFDAREKTSKQRPQSAGPRPRFTASSTNQLEYPNWGPTHPYHMKRYYEPVPTQDLAFSGCSEYGKHFQSRDTKGAASKATGANDHSSLALHGNSIKLESKTTAKTEFRALLGVHKAQSCKKNERILDMTAPLEMYQTEYSKKFIPQAPLVKNPQDVLRYLSARAAC